MDIAKVVLLAPYNYDADAVSLATGCANNEPSVTDQSFANEVDINTIVKRFGLTGEMPQQVVFPTYADFEQVYDFHSAMVELRRAEQTFMTLPAHVRAEFDNDPGRLLSFLEDEANRPKAESLGLVKPAPQAPANEPAKPANEPAKPANEPAKPAG